MRQYNQRIMHLLRTIAALLIATVSHFDLFAQAMGNLMYESSSRMWLQQAEQPVKATLQGNTLVLEVNAMMNMTADSYLAIFHVTQLGQSAEEADSLMNTRIQAFAQRVGKEGVKSTDVFTDMLSFVPVYETEVTRKLFSKSYQEVPAGFEIQKNIHVRFTDARVLDRLVTAAAKEEIYDLVKVDYFVERQSACYDTLRLFATRLLQQKLDNFEKLGLRLKEGHRIGAEQNGAYFPLDRYAAYQSRVQTSLNSTRKGQMVNDVRQPKSFFYNKVPYGRFDIVLHAEITEPPVQYTYNLTMQVQLPEGFPKHEAKELVKYVMITDKGELRELKL